MSVTVGYWDIRGYGEPIRYMLRYVGVDYVDRRYKTDDTVVYTDPKHIEDWMNEKFNLGLDFPNIPYYIEGDLKLTETKAILRYLGRKHKLFGQTEDELTRIDMIENYMYDLHTNGLKKVVYTPVIDPTQDYETLKAEYLSTLDSKLKEISNFLGKYEWMGGKGLTFVDFYTYEILDWVRLFKTDYFNKYQNLIDYMNRFESLPPIHRYMNSNQFSRYPMLGSIAVWGYKPQ